MEMLDACCMVGFAMPLWSFLDGFMDKYIEILKRRGG